MSRNQTWKCEKTSPRKSSGKMVWKWYKSTSSKPSIHQENHLCAYVYSPFVLYSIKRRKSLKTWILTISNPFRSASWLVWHHNLTEFKLSSMMSLHQVKWSKIDKLVNGYQSFINEWVTNGPVYGSSITSGSMVMESSMSWAFYGTLLTGHTSSITNDTGQWTWSNISTDPPHQLNIWLHTIKCLFRIS